MRGTFDGEQSDGGSMRVDDDALRDGNVLPGDVNRISSLAHRFGYSGADGSLTIATAEMLVLGTHAHTNTVRQR